MKVIKPIQFENFSHTRASEATYYNENGLVDIAAINVIRFGYNPETLEPIGAIFENASTNLLTYANNFPLGWLTRTDVEFYSDVFNSDTPDGSNPATYVEYTGGLVTGGIYRDNPIPIGEKGTFSVYLKYLTGAPKIYSLAGCGAAYFNIETREITTITSSADSAGIELLPNGWCRCWVTGDSNNVELSIGTNTIGDYRHYVWGAQIEAGSSVTSFIYTDSSTATRAADTPSSPPAVVYSNVPEDDEPEWNDSTDYNVGTLVIVTDTHRVYKATAASGPGEGGFKYPPDNLGAFWVDQGATNRWRIFDMKVGADLQTTHEDLINFIVNFDEPVKGVSLFNIEATDYILRQFDENNNLLFEDIGTLISDPLEASYYEYYFGQRKLIPTKVFTELAPVYPGSIEIELTNSWGDFVKLGKLIVGNIFDIGGTEYGAGVGITNYSVKTTDEFGNNSILPRRFVGNGAFRVVVTKDKTDAAYEFLADVRNIACAYLGTEVYRSSDILGFFQDFDIVFSTYDLNYCSLQIEGI